MESLQHLIAFAQSNQIFSGVAAAGGFASAVYWLREIPARILGMMVWGCSTELDIANDSEAFEPFLMWLAAHGGAWHARCLKLSTDGYRLADDQDGQSYWTVAPGIGSHLVWYRGRACWVTRWINERGDSRNLRVRETIRLRMLGFSRRPLTRLIEEVKRAAQRPGKLSVAVWSSGYWETVRTCDPRGFETIVLGDGIKERLAEDLAWFRSSREWYRHRGLPWRRGYLFAGPPGTGKTSLALALAGRFEMPVYALNLGSIATDDILIEAIGAVPAGAILLIEDIDTARVSTTRAVEDEQKRERAPAGLVTLGALLNVLDGAISRDGRVVVMTSNHVDRLDPALVRPGRVDLRIEFPLAGAVEIATIYGRFFEGRRLDVPLGMSLAPAEVQAICLQYAGDPEAAARRLLPGGVRIVEAEAVA